MLYQEMAWHTFYLLVNMMEMYFLGFRTTPNFGIAFVKYKYSYAG